LLWYRLGLHGRAVGEYKRDVVRNRARNVLTVQFQPEVHRPDELAFVGNLIRVIVLGASGSDIVNIIHSVIVAVWVTLIIRLVAERAGGARISGVQCARPSRTGIVAVAELPVIAGGGVIGVRATPRAVAHVVGARVAVWRARVTVRAIMDVAGAAIACVVPTVGRCPAVSGRRALRFGRVGDGDPGERLGATEPAAALGGAVLKAQFLAIESQ
jgi:hypothetical protein